MQYSVVALTAALGLSLSLGGCRRAAEQVLATIDDAGAACLTADGSSAQCQPLARGGGPRSAGNAMNPRTVSERFTHAFANGCEFRSTVTGILRPAPGGAAANGQGGTLFAPDLRVRAGVYCRDGRSTETERPIVGPAQTRAEIEQQMEAIAVVWDTVAEQRCVYTVDFELSENALRQQDVAFACRGPQRGQVWSGDAVRGANGSER